MPNIHRKLLAVSILLALLMATWVLLGKPYVDLWQERIAQAERLQRKQLALRQLIDNRENFEQQYAALSDSNGLQQVFLDEKSGALADVKLQGIVKQIVTDSGARLVQAVIKQTRAPRNGQQARDARENPEDKSVTVQVMMQGSLEMIYSALQALENSRPLILVDNLQIAHVRARYRAAEAESSDTSYRASYDATAFIL